jgi:D-alanyl-lipoteichoic acid acyltransferase DltB (MBOAT superfamily)
MRLDSGAFLALFAVYFLVYSAAPARVKRVLLVCGSIAFYATTSLRWVPLLLGLGVFTFFVSRRLHAEAAPRRRDVLLWVGVGVNLLALGAFKLAPVTGGSFAQLVAPLGLSFYTLQAISCVVDVHRKMYEPPKSVVSFLASFTLFPHLLSGPIVRSSFLVPLVENVEGASWRTARRALVLFTAGIVKKAIADRLAPAADAAFDATHAISGLQAWTGLLAYAGQLYGDFSGYTDMATALALLLGLDLPANFRLPYLATSPADFWRRWHITLSSWLRDYVYLPLGVRFRRRRYTNIVATWIVAGLWHGVSVSYVLYGAYHGVLLAATDALDRRFGGDGPPSGIRRVALTALTFYLVLMGYVLFRARSVAAAGRFFVTLHAPHVASTFSRDALTGLGTSLAAIVFCHLLDHAVQRRGDSERAWILWPAMAAAIACVTLFRGAAQPFIYLAF